MKRIVLILLSCAVVAALTLRPADAEPSLVIGSKAPALDIEHWVQDGNGNYPHVSNFEKGKVYVVEFWATWCGPCIASMPHLAELQTEYRDRGVQIISISDESLDEVDALLKREHPEAKKSFAEITSAYSLTTDPDGSSQADYMEAAEQRGIPTAFIVGKSGLVEWIGHPGNMDEPLEAVVDDKWDREAYKEELKRQQAFEEAVQQFAQLAGQGKLEEAGKMLKDQIAASQDDEIKQQWTMIQHQFRLMTGQADEADFAFYREDLKERIGNPIAVAQHGLMLFGMVQNGGKVGPLAAEAVTALQNEVEAADDEDKPLFYQTIAQLYTIDDQIDKAIASQEKAIEFASDNQKKRLMPFLEELKSVAKKAAGGDADAQPTDKDATDKDAAGDK
ncbi:TlpA family protein disulfide reductase [Stieleria sp. TO1_6]|uniref:redoxin domain-containing protein n=1 Tax=Stieleria tagensis TaxID=2956795 RepID=UPI00209B8952|nr:redoxin domain-containing protein [Stieleria tagensis]MCO8125043.1 TlpA family protein disulfide reductase [Stieleria tagensis]